MVWAVKDDIIRRLKYLSAINITVVEVGDYNEVIDKAHRYIGARLSKCFTVPETDETVLTDLETDYAASLLAENLAIMNGAPVPEYVASLRNDVEKCLDRIISGALDCGLTAVEVDVEAEVETESTQTRSYFDMTEPHGFRKDRATL